MERPQPPRLEDYGLTESQYGMVPKLLRHRLSENTYTHLGLIIGAAVALWSFIAFFNRMESALRGWYFGIPIGFVVFLMASFLGAVFVKFLVHGASAVQRRLIGAVSDTARRAFLYDDHKVKHQKELALFTKLYT